jgi:maltose alpha-D-glucosyltransferase/alpha-amylase
MILEERVGEALASSMSWLQAQRWFGDKSRTLVDVSTEVFASVQLRADQAALIVTRCTFESGPDSLYFVPLVGFQNESTEPDAQPGRGHSVRDALTDSDFLAWLLAGFQDRRAATAAGTWTWSATHGSDRELALVDVYDSRVMEVEQSNTSILFDHRIMAKVFRRLQPGINPDLEVTRYLTETADFPHVPRVYGVFELERDGQTYVLGVLQQFVTNVGDGWGWLLKELRGLTKERRGALLDSVELLGQRTAELHVALGAETDVEAFRPDLMTSEQASSLGDRVAEELDQTMALLRARDARPVDDVRDLETQLRRRIAETEALVGTLQIRVHGDYHLGQVLRTVDHDFAIIDFEGEPSRSIAQRREKFSPLRDVAGMLRSLDYAVGASTKSLTNQEHVELIREWGMDARESYLRGYRAAITDGDARLVPGTDETFDAALHVLEIEKSLYEARYEMDNRPDWLSIPLGALVALAHA